MLFQVNILSSPEDEKNKWKAPRDGQMFRDWDAAQRLRRRLIDRGCDAWIRCIREIND